MTGGGSLLMGTLIDAHSENYEVPLIHLHPLLFFFSPD
jgi:hypothetical protein